MRRAMTVAFFVCFTLAGLAPAASAATIMLDATSRGWFGDDGAATGGNHGAAAANYGAGLYNSGGLHEYRNFFIFDLASVTDVIVSAALRISPAWYSSNDASETFSLYDVTTPLDSLTDRTGGVGAFTDLGSGTTYGSGVFTAADAGVVPMTIALNAAALANLQAAIGTRIGLGGAVTSIGGYANELLFGGSEGGAQLVQLVLETQPAPPPPSVPEPATLLLIGTGLVAMASHRRGRTNG